MWGMRKKAAQRTSATARIVVGLVLMAVMFGAAVPLVSATTITGTQTISSHGELFEVNYDNVTIRLDGQGTSTILQGQVIQFYNRSGGPVGTVTLMGISGDAEDHEQFSDTSGKLDTEVKKVKPGTYIATCTEGCDTTTITVEEPYLTLKLKRNENTITSIPKGSRFTIELSTNLDPYDSVTLVVEEPDGDILQANTDGTVFDTVNVDHLTDLGINTAGWELGTYTFQVITKEEYARGLDAESSKVNLELATITQTISSHGELFEVNYDNLTIWLDGSKTQKILQGQVIQFYSRSGGPVGTVTLMGVSGDAEDHEQFSDTSGKLDTEVKKVKPGTYIATCTVGCDNTTITVEEPYLKLKLKRNGKTITSIPRGSNFTIDLSTNLDPHDGVTLVVEVPGGYIRGANYDGTVFEYVNVDHLTDLVINTTGWELGAYTFQVITEEEYARGLDAESTEEDLEIVSGELKIEAQKTEVVELENVRLTVTGVPDRKIALFVERNGEHAIFPASLNDNPSNDTDSGFTDTIGADGEMVYVVNFDRIGLYTVKVRDQAPGGAEDYVDIAVSKKKVTFTTPETCAIGSDLIINGTANTGKTLDIAIEDVIVKAGVAIDSAGKFEVKLRTPETVGTGTEDAIKIRGFIVEDGEGYSEGDDVSEFNDDGSTLVLMVSGDLTADSSVSLIPPGDLFTLSGTAKGTKVVDILIVGPDGGSGHGMNPINSKENGLPSGMSYEVASVSSGTSSWSIELEVDKNADTGQYLVFVLTPGRNQEYDGIGTDDLLQGLAADYFGGDLSRLETKTQEQIRAILTEATKGASGSDDLMKTVKVLVGKAELMLYPLDDVVIGENLTVHGASNREGQTVIIRVVGPLTLGTKFVTVADGAFTATFSTLEALTGEYTVEANDGEGHTDTKTVKIVVPTRTREVSSTTPAPTGESTTAMPSPASGAESETTPTAQPETSELLPGFEALAVALAIVVVFLFAAIARKRRG